MSWQDILKRTVLFNKMSGFLEYLQLEAEPPFIGHEYIEAVEGDILGSRPTVKVREPLVKKITEQKRIPFRSKAIAEQYGAKDSYYEEGGLYIGGIKIVDYFMEFGEYGLNYNYSLTDSDIQKVFDYFVDNIYDSESDLQQYKKYLPEMYAEAQRLSRRD